MPDRLYDGPYPAVDLILEGGSVTVKLGETVPVSDDEAQSLDAQGDWITPTAEKQAVPNPDPAEATAPVASP